MFVKDNMYCYGKQVDKVRKYIPYGPQQSKENVVQLQRYYSNSAADANCKKRVTWVCQEDGTVGNTVLVECKGRFPDHRPHGKSKGEQTYTRTSQQTMENLQAAVNHGRKPVVVFDNIVQDTSIDDMARKVKQVRNMKHNQKGEMPPMLQIEILLTRSNRSRQWETVMIWCNKS